MFLYYKIYNGEMASDTGFGSYSVMKIREEWQTEIKKQSQMNDPAL